VTECLGDNVCTNPRCPTHGIEWDADRFITEYGKVEK
jgi:hypothetical protein